MGMVFPVDDYVGRELFPRFAPEDSDAPLLFEGLGVFRKADEQRLWVLDFHGVEGVPPLGLAVVAEGPILGSQLAADRIPLPTGRGLTARVVGGSLYAAEVPLRSHAELLRRAELAERRLPGLIEEFPDAWEKAAAELEAWYRRLEESPPPGSEPDALLAYLDEALAVVRYAWHVHFEMMYVLLAAHFGFLGLCSELRISAHTVALFFQGYESKISDTDRALWRLADAARDAGLADAFRTAEPEDLAATIPAAGPAGQRWWEEFQSFLSAYGWRTEGVYDVTLPTWVEDPTSPLGTIKTFLLRDEAHDFDGALADAVAERERAVTEARGQLTAEEQVLFDDALARCRRANFTWWNEDHNYYIDLRSHIPVRQAGLAIGREYAADPTDVLFLFIAEIRALLQGERAWESFEATIAERRAAYVEGNSRRSTLPRLLGTLPDDVDDPVLREIFGINRHFLAAISAVEQQAEVLEGLPASAGVARGPARVLHGATELHRIEPGEILVCEATTPNWTPAFAKIAACVCDAGGSLTHAAIVSREYRIPCVTGTAVATARIRTGDLVEVDGTAGRVRVLSRADARPSLESAGAR